ncbi:MAG TPA: hypothetical protein VJM47_04905 [Nitrosospira sp.]|jgi:hypothetical protein|nr:hypothetical protein [Nitrosospira sp.]
MNDDLSSRLAAIDADCENAAKAELDSLFENAPSATGTTLRGPSPQAAEAIWLRLIGRKEQEFIQEIRIAKQKTSGNSVGAGGEAKSVEETINDLLADERYLERMREFYAQLAGKTVAETSQAQAKRLDLIDTTYRTGVQDALRRTRKNVFAELNLSANRGDDAAFLSQWKQYSTLSPWRSIWTIVLLSLTSYLIAFVIASDAFRAMLERFGWSTGTGM